MDYSRLALIALILAFAIWRLVRYLKLGMAKRHPGLVSGAGMLVQAGDSSTGAAPPARPLRFWGALGGCAVWVLCNLVILAALFGLPVVRDAPPIILMVAAVFPNFYVIPISRGLAEKWSTPKAA